MCIKQCAKNVDFIGKIRLSYLFIHIFNCFLFSFLISLYALPIPQKKSYYMRYFNEKRKKMKKICFADSDPLDEDKYLDSKGIFTNSSSDDASDYDTAPPPIKKMPNKLPTYDGVFLVGVSQRKVPYHISLAYDDTISEEKMFSMAMHTCRVACIALDIARGHPIMPVMNKMLSSDCIKKLHNMWVMVGEHLRELNDPILNFEVCRLPVNPHLVNGIMVEPTHFEGVVRMTTGYEQYWTSLSLKYKRGEWICTYADIG